MPQRELSFKFREIEFGGDKIENEKYRVSIPLIASQTSHLLVAALKIEY